MREARVKWLRGASQLGRCWAHLSPLDFNLGQTRWRRPPLGSPASGRLVHRLASECVHRPAGSIRSPVAGWPGASGGRRRLQTSPPAPRTLEKEKKPRTPPITHNGPGTLPILAPSDPIRMNAHARSSKSTISPARRPARPPAGPLSRALHYVGGSRVGRFAWLGRRIAYHEAAGGCACERLANSAAVR